MLKHGPHRLFEHDHVYIYFMCQVFLVLNLELLSSVKMPLTRLHTRPHILRSLQNCSSPTDILVLSSEN